MYCRTIEMKQFSRRPIIWIEFFFHQTSSPFMMSSHNSSVTTPIMCATLAYHFRQMRIPQARGVSSFLLSWAGKKIQNPSVGYLIIPVFLFDVHLSKVSLIKRRLRMWSVSRLTAIMLGVLLFAIQICSDLYGWLFWFIVLYHLMYYAS